MNFASIIIWLWTITVLHPMHISVTHVDFNADTGSFEITHKIFIDDFESALKLYNNKDFKLGTEKEIPDADKYIQEYMAQQFGVKVNGKTVLGEYLGREMDLEAIWIYHEIKNVSEAEAIEIKNAILLDLYDDQKNILHIKYKNQKQSFLFRQDQTIDKMEID
jgi:hypothetical protein